MLLNRRSFIGGDDGEHELTLLALELLANGIDPASAVERARNIAALLGAKPEAFAPGQIINTPTTVTHHPTIGPPPWKMPLKWNSWIGGIEDADNKYVYADTVIRWTFAAWEALGRP